ncbi:MAG: hypothetical protein V3W04_01135 [Gammaproteobacteria bacterium]
MKIFQIHRIVFLFCLACATTSPVVNADSVFDPALLDILRPPPLTVDLIDQGLIDQPFFDLDNLLLTKVPGNRLLLEAEKAGLIRGREFDRHLDFTGSGYVVLKGEGAIAWSFNVQQSGIHRLQFRYALKTGNRPVDIAVRHITDTDDVPAQLDVAFAATGSFSEWQIASFIVRLKNGINTIKLSATGSGAAFIDHLVLTEARYLTEGGNISPKAGEPEFGEAGYRNTYYGKVDPSGKRTTLEDWKRENGFTGSSSQPGLVTAEYINGHDLGFGRSMFCLDGSRVSCYVENSLDPKNLLPDTPDGGLFAATVTMERMDFLGRVITAFFVFDQNGKRTNQIALDTEGPKSVPESCYACHLGYTSAGGNPVGGQYLPWDLALLEDWPGKAPLSAQLDAIRRLNQIVWRDASRLYSRAIFTDPLDPGTFTGNEIRHRKPSLKTLIEDWYDGPPVAGSNFSSLRALPKTTWFDEDVRVDPCLNTSTPAGLEKCNRFAHQFSLFTGVYARACRTCHIAQGEAQNVNPSSHGLDWASAREFETQAYNTVCVPGPGVPVMPHAEVTFKRFETDVLRTRTSKEILCSTPPVPPPVITGEGLYAANCASCHGPLASSTKRGRSVGQIMAAISSVSSMNRLNNLTGLTNTEITAIAEALGN